MPVYFSGRTIAESLEVLQEGLSEPQKSAVAGKLQLCAAIRERGMSGGLAWVSWRIPKHQWKCFPRI